MGNGRVVHDFQSSLAFSQEHKDDPFWEKIYRKTFSNFLTMVSCDPGHASESQYRGIDRIVYLTNDQIIRVDEKKRRPDKHGNEYRDILLEFISNDVTGAKGWIAKDLAIDYLAYAFIKSQRCYLFPWHLLRRAWLHYGEEWVEKGSYKQDGFRIIDAENKGYRGRYKTISIVIPISLLVKKVADATIIQL